MFNLDFWRGVTVALMAVSLSIQAITVWMRWKIRRLRHG